MKKILLKCSMLFTMAVMFWGCYPDGPETAEELDIVYTNHAKDFVFAGHNKYAMPDSIVKITGSVTGPTFVDNTYAVQVLNRIKANMSALGYTLVPDTSLADFVLLPACMQVEITTYYYDYYYYYYGWYYPYYPYYPYTVSTTYTTGTLAMSLVDRMSPNVNGSRTVVWIGLVNGLMESGSTSFATRLNTTVDQAFAQSDYLHQ